MIMGIAWTHLESVWNPSGPSEVPYWSGTIIFRFLQQTGSKDFAHKVIEGTY